VSQYVRSIVVKRDFEGDKVTVLFKPVKFVDALKYRNLDTSKLEEDDVPGLFDGFKGYVEKLSGLRTDDGLEVTLDEFFSLFYFSTLLIDVLEEWIERGAPKNPSLPGALQVASQPG
jgi:hypothetical protein